MLQSDPLIATNYPPASGAFQGRLLYSVGPETVACLEPAPEDIFTSGQGSSRRQHHRPGTPCQSNFANAIFVSKINYKSKMQTRKPVTCRYTDIRFGLKSNIAAASTFKRYWACNALSRTHLLEFCGRSNICTACAKCAVSARSQILLDESCKTAITLPPP